MVWANAPVASAETDTAITRKRTGACRAFTNPPSLFAGQSYDCALDVKQLADPVQRLSGDRRIARDVDVIEIAPHMRPARDFGHSRRLPVGHLVKRSEAGISVGLQKAVEVGELRADVRPCDRENSDKRQPAAPCRRPGVRRAGSRPKAARSWSCRCRALKPALVCRPHAASQPP